MEVSASRRLKNNNHNNEQKAREKFINQQPGQPSAAELSHEKSTAIK